jgi:hypothetical protein
VTEYVSPAVSVRRSRIWSVLVGPWRSEPAGDEKVKQRNPAKIRATARDAADEGAIGMFIKPTPLDSRFGG